MEKNIFTAKANLREGFKVVSSSTHKEDYEMFIESEKDGPMDLFTVAFSGCILMCAKGYFVRTYNRKDIGIDLDLDVDYDNKKCVTKIVVDYPGFTEEDRVGILENIKLRCKISHLLSDEVERVYEIVKKQENR
ncbi:MAG: hypothetical protein Q3988_01735 [Gemella sp.]|nr:hypothetical protein [Gemella sp.]